MLVWFRKMQTIIAPLMLTVFLSSLFALFCQHCLMKLEQARQLAAVVSSHHDGHCTHNGGSKPEPMSPAKPCMSVCDCGDNSMLIADKHSITINDFRDYAEIKIPISIAYTSDYTPAVLAYVIGKPDKPDRACFSPLERNCVLLN